MATTPPPGCPIERRHRLLAKTSLESSHFACKATLATATYPASTSRPYPRSFPISHNRNRSVSWPALGSWQAHRETHRGPSKDNRKVEKDNRKVDVAAPQRQ